MHCALCTAQCAVCCVHCAVCCLYSYCSLKHSLWNSSCHIDVVCRDSMKGHICIYTRNLTINKWIFHIKSCRNRVVWRRVKSPHYCREMLRTAAIFCIIINVFVYVCVFYCRWRCCCFEFIELLLRLLCSDTFSLPSVSLSVSSIVLRTVFRCAKKNNNIRLNTDFICILGIYVCTSAAYLFMYLFIGRTFWCM